MSTPVQGGPSGPLGYAPRRTREAGTVGVNTASPPQEDKPPRIVTALRDELDSGVSEDTPSLRDALPSGAPSLRDALSSQDGLPARDPLAPLRGGGSLRGALSP